jgi:hypothetical protein
MVASMSVFWVVPLCSLVEVYQHLRGTCCLHHRPDDGAANTSETLVKFYKTIWCYNPEDSYLHTLSLTYSATFSDIFCHCDD